MGSACAVGELFRAMLDHKDWGELRRIAAWYDFLEIQPICNNAFLLEKGQIADQEGLRDLNRTIVKLGRELGKPVCATGDVHFLDPEQEIFRHILLNASGFSDADKELPIYLKTTDEMLEEFAYLGQEDCRKVVVEAPKSTRKNVRCHSACCQGSVCAQAGELREGAGIPGLRQGPQAVWGRTAPDCPGPD